MNINGRKKKIKNYRFIKSIGKGSFAEVFQVLDENDHQIKAMKQIFKEHFKDKPKLKQLIKNEVQILKSCNNDNVTKFYEFLESEKNIYIVMEYCKDGDMKQFLKNQPKRQVPEKEALKIMKQLLSGFEALHKIEAMHRDFKPENVLLNDGVFKICDLGFGTIGDLAATCLGTTNYMAPEIIKKNGKYNSKIDIWSLGVVLFEMLFGEMLFWGQTDDLIAHEVLTKTLEFADSKVKISEECKDLLSKMVERDPQKRISWLDIHKHPVFQSEIQKDLKNKNTLGSLINSNDIKLSSSLRFYDNFHEERKKILPLIEEKTIETFPTTYDDLKKPNQNEEFEEFKNAEVENYENIEEMVKKQNSDNKEKKREIENLEKHFIFIRNLLNHIAKTLMNGFAMSTALAHNYPFLVVLKKLERFIILIVLEFRKMNFFDSNYFSEFSKCSFYQESMKFLENDLQDIQAKLIGYYADLIENCVKSTKLLGDLKKLFSEEIDEATFNELFEKLMKFSIHDIEKIINSLLSYKKNLSAKEVRLNILLFLDCLDWETLFKFDEKDECGFDFENYSQEMQTLEENSIAGKIKEKVEILLMKKPLTNFILKNLKK